MRRFPLLGAALFIPALALCLSVSGCSKSEPSKPAAPPPSAATPEAKSEAKKEATATAGAKLTAPTDGVLKGFVKFDGTPPALVPNESIAKHTDKETCMKGGPFEKSDQTWLVNKDGGVAYAVVFLTSPSAKFDVTPELKKAFAQPAVLDQPHCAFVPHILGIYPDAGQKLEVKNSAAVSHNTKITGDVTKNPPYDKSLPPGKHDELPVKYQGKDPLRVACSQHPWMNGMIFTFNNPYFAVTNADGAFEIKNVPSGVELVVNVWHESFGASLKNAKEAEKKTLKSGDNEVTLKVK